MILTEDCLSYLTQQVERSQKCDFAVAFWGEGAGLSLGLVDAEGSLAVEADVRLICNLRTGATDPVEIKKLMDAGIAVKHSDTLHAKVYRFDDAAVVGSANASANGLGRDGEAAYWNEVGALVQASADLTALDAWFKRTWDRAGKVEENDLKEAARARARRKARHSRVKRSNPLRDGSLIDVLRSRPEVVAGREIYLVCNTKFYGAPIRQHLDEVGEETGKRPDVYADWQPPSNAMLIDFSWPSQHAALEFDGFFQSPRHPATREFKDHTLYNIELIDCIPSEVVGFPITNASIEAELPRWKELVEASKSGLPEVWEASGCCIKLDVLAGYLGQRKRSVLNVLDKHRRYTEDADGLGLSGFWKGPDKQPDTIRIYAETNGRSVAGGSIIERRRREDGRIVIVFRPDPNEQDHPWPEARFRQNGCVATEC